MKGLGGQGLARDREIPRVNVLMLLSNAYDPDPRVRQEALELIALGCRVRILAWDRDLKASPFELNEGVEVRRVFLSSVHGRGTTQLFFYVVLYFKILYHGWRFRFDVVHCHDLDMLPIGFVLGKLKRKAIVYDAHESFPDMLDGSVHALVKRGLIWLENFLIRRINLLITVSEQLKSQFARRRAARSVVVGNWKRLEDYSRTEQQSLEIRHDLEIPDGALVITYITQLLKDRKIEELLEAVDRSPDVYVIIGGKGAMEDRVREWSSRNNRIRYIGFVKPEQIPAYTCSADIIYYGFDTFNPNSRYSAPNKLYEALASGKPLITGDFGEIAEVVRRAKCGIVLADYSAESIAQAIDALRRPDVRETFAGNSKRFGREAMNWRMGQQILQREYRRLLPAAKQLALTNNGLELSAGA